MSEPRSGAQAIERALSVLRCFESERTQGISELARRTGLTMSTTHRVTRAQHPPSWHALPQYEMSWSRA